jgi:hypothetical protein
MKDFSLTSNTLRGVGSQPCFRYVNRHVTLEKNLEYTNQYSALLIPSQVFCIIHPWTQFISPGLSSALQSVRLSLEYLWSLTSLPRYLQEILRTLKYQAVDIEIWCNAWRTTNKGRKVSRFESLKELTIVYDGGQLPRGPSVEEDIDFSTEAPETPFWLNNLHAVIKARLEEKIGRFPDWEMPQWKLKKMGERQNK